MGKVVGFGDFLVRLSPPGVQRFIQCAQYELNYTGAEANVCVSLAMMGVETEFVTRLPRHDVAYAGLAMLKKYGVGVDHVAFGGERMGIFYAEKGASQRPSKIIYDRKHTSIAEARIEDFDWEAIFDGAERLHMTGITPALSGTMPAVFHHAVNEAKRRGVFVSCDLNYRKNMWTEAEAKACMEPIIPQIDLLIANEEDADKVLGIRAAGSDVTAGRLSREGYAGVARQLCERYGVVEVAITLRNSISASDNEWGALLYANKTPYFSRTYPVHIVDRIGGGDSFSAGLLYGKMHGFEPQRAVEYAAAASCLKHSIEMDFNLSTVDEIEHLMRGDGSGRVQR